MHTTGWFVIFGVSILVFIWAKQRQLKDQRQEAVWQKKYGQVIAAIRRTNTLSDSITVVSPIVAILSLIAGIISLIAVS